MKLITIESFDCIICGDVGFTFGENSIRFCHLCRGSLTKDQMVRIQKSLELTEDPELIIVLRSTYESLKDSLEGNLNLLHASQAMGIKDAVNLYKLKSYINGMIDNNNKWLRDNKVYDNTPVLSWHQHFNAIHIILNRIKEKYD